MDRKPSKSIKPKNNHTKRDRKAQRQAEALVRQAAFDMLPLEVKSARNKGKVYVKKETRTQVQ